MNYTQSDFKGLSKTLKRKKPSVPAMKKNRFVKMVILLNAQTTQEDSLCKAKIFKDKETESQRKGAPNSRFKKSFFISKYY